MLYQEDKFINAVLFFGKNTDPELFGRKKLWKLLFLMDLYHFKEYCRPILNDSYKLRQYGPVPESSYMLFMDTVEEGIKTKLTEVINTQPTPVGDYTLDKIIPLKDPDKEIFSDSELEIMGKVARENYAKRGGEIEKEIKKDSIIRNIKTYEIIDFKEFIKDKNKRKYCEYWEKEDEILEKALAQK